MAIVVTKNEGGGGYDEGWKTVTVSEATKGEFNGSKYVDLFFDGYPETFKLRVFQAHNKENHEEFAIARFFKFANAGVIDIIKSSDGKESSNLNGTKPPKTESVPGKASNVEVEDAFDKLFND